MTNTHATTDSTTRRPNRLVLGVITLGAVALGTSACYDEDIANAVPSDVATGQAQATAGSSSTPAADDTTAEVEVEVEVEVEATSVQVIADGIETVQVEADKTVAVKAVADDSDADADTIPAPVLDLSHTGEGENTYVDDFGTLRNAGNDEPICPNPLPTNGLDTNGNHILIDGRTGLPLCDDTGAFITIPGDHDDSDNA